ncbi:hypothetical protein [Streptomyces sp. 4F14]|uniref:hypothetical protein n=1 Tax=Streptomyces sp. 4F14 TaxID=3394380 RepID=UPI003A89D859
MARPLEARPEDDRRGHALTRARLAELPAADGRIGKAGRHWEVFLDLCPYVRSVRVTESPDLLHRGLRPFPQDRRAAALRERALTLCRPTTMPRG